jgi:uncharacterized SAM-binding protein YcdF (DUF218 family)
VSQFFAPLAEPLGAVWLLMALVVVGLLWRRHWQIALWLGIPTVLLFIIGSTPVAEMLVAAEERPWVGPAGGAGQLTEVGGLKAESSKSESGDIPRVSTSPFHHEATVSQPATVPADAVIALGGGQRVSHHDVLGFAMGEGGSRVLTAIEMVRSGKARTLVLGGSWPMPERPNVPSIWVVQAWVSDWRLVEGAVTNLGICINTHDEAIAYRKLAQDQGWSRVLLVTSALHLRRSVALFWKQGVAVTPVAADFQVQGVSQDLPFSPFPRQRRFVLLALYLHEKIGWWVYRARGWV